MSSLVFFRIPPARGRREDRLVAEGSAAARLFPLSLARICTMTTPTPITSAWQSWFPLQPGLPDYEEMLLALPRLQAAGLKALLEEQREMVAFVKHRCDADLHLADRIAHANAFKEVFDAMLVFYEAAAKDYSAEAAKLAERSSHAAGDVMKSVKQEAASLTRPQAVKQAA